jgi:hypothetical protein
LQRRFPREPIDQAEIISRVLTLFQRRGRLPPGQPVPVPFAFAFAKSDLFASPGLARPGARLLRSPRYKGGFDRRDCRQLSEEMEAYLTAWGGQRLLDLARDKVRTSCFFALSALGQTPEEGTMRINALQPRRVADPLLWLLWLRGYIPACRVTK